MAGLTKVAHVARRFAPEKWGGTECVVFNLSRELIRQGIESPVFCTAMFAAPGLQCLEEVPVKRYRYVFPWFGLSPEAKAQLRLKGGSPLSLPLFFGLLAERNLSLIHVHVQHRLGGMARTVAKLRGIPLVVSLHGGHYTLPPEQVEKMIDPFRGKLEWGKGKGVSPSMGTVNRVGL
jgi:glycosyltransferase involved in cell wall biosynthesis